MTLFYNKINFSDLKTMATPRRELLRRPDVPRRRSARQALAMIPDSTSTNVSPGMLCYFH